ncbi:MAG: EamA family transporter [Pseudomonadales bacterium]|nr:EamA family transporter [Pseudomonadales bacterium]
MKDRTLLSDLLLLVVTLLAASGWIFSKEALQGMSPLWFLGIRFFSAGCLLGALCIPQLKAMTRRQWRQALWMGLLFALALMLWVHGLFFSTHVGEGAFITSLGVVLVPVVARLAFGDATEGSTWVALPLAVGGLACLSLRHGFRFEPSQAFFCGAALLFALHFNLISRALAQIPAFALTTIQLTMVGSVALLAAAVSEGPLQVDATAVWGWLVASILLASSARFLIQAYAQSMASASHAAIIMILEPLWASIMAAVWFAEQMSLQQLAGCSLIFLALLVNRWRAIRQLLRSLLR